MKWRKVLWLGFVSGLLNGFVFFAGQLALAPDGTIAPPENLVVEGVPAIPASLVETAGRYGSYRGATLADWSPTRREMLIATRFADNRTETPLQNVPVGVVTNLKWHSNSRELGFSLTNARGPGDLFLRCDDGEAGTMDDERNSGEDQRVSRSRAGAMGKL